MKFTTHVNIPNSFGAAKDHTGKRGVKKPDLAKQQSKLENPNKGQDQIKDSNDVKLQESVRNKDINPAGSQTLSLGSPKATSASLLMKSNLPTVTEIASVKSSDTFKTEITPTVPLAIVQDEQVLTRDALSMQSPTSLELSNPIRPTFSEKSLPLLDSIPTDSVKTSTLLSATEKANSSSIKQVFAPTTATPLLTDPVKPSSVTRLTAPVKDNLATLSQEKSIMPTTGVSVSLTKNVLNVLETPAVPATATPLLTDPVKPSSVARLTAPVKDSLAITSQEPVQSIIPTTRVSTSLTKNVLNVLETQAVPATATPQLTDQVKPPSVTWVTAPVKDSLTTSLPQQPVKSITATTRVSASLPKNVLNVLESPSVPIEKVPEQCDIEHDESRYKAQNESIFPKSEVVVAHNQTIQLSSKPNRSVEVVKNISKQSLDENPHVRVPMKTASSPNLKYYGRSGSSSSLAIIEEASSTSNDPDSNFRKSPDQLSVPYCVKRSRSGSILKSTSPAKDDESLLNVSPPKHVHFLIEESQVTTSDSGFQQRRPPGRKSASPITDQSKEPLAYEVCKMDCIDSCVYRKV